jgi:malonate-semialdehyde dehydrogenase (acetylating)/methylmalonate-semialdehyde dehydrogenase
MSTSTEKLLPCPLFINGEWIARHDLPSSPVHNPSTGEVIAQTPLADAKTVGEAVQAASEAFPAWWETPAIERARVLFNYRTLLENDFDEICKIISHEHGKTLAESRGELQRGLECVEYACGIPELLKGEYLENIARGIDCEVIRQPLGVCAGITPFNFPVMIAMWMFPLAIASGNTFIFKPSEKVPLTAVRIVQLLEKAGLPKGVLNLVHGGKESVDALLSHPDVRAISFVGSTPVAKYIYETGTRNGKRVQANGGAKNHVIIMPDADVKSSVDGIMGGAFGCAGERCMAIATAVCVGDASKTVLPVLADSARNLKIGPTDREPQPQMGPVITREHCDRVTELIIQGAEQGGKLLSDGRAVDVSEAPNGFYLGATVVDEVQPDSTLADTEVFGPVLSVMRAGNLEEALQLANASAFGNGTAIFTTSGSAAREFKHRVKAGMVGINVGVPAPMAMFPFSGWDSSFFGDLHIQGRDGVRFYTREKTVTSRWFGEGDVWRK